MATAGARLVAAWDVAFNTACEDAADLFAPGASYTDHRPLGWEPIRGREAIREWFRSLSSAGATMRATSRVIEEAPPRVLVAQRFRFVAVEADGGGEGEAEVWVLLRIEDGLIAELDLFGDVETARTALA